MNEIKLMNALGMIGEDELCNYFEYSETLAAKTRKRIRTISVRVAVAAVIVITNKYGA